MIVTIKTHFSAAVLCMEKQNEDMILYAIGHERSLLEAVGLFSQFDFAINYKWRITGSEPFIHIQQTPDP